MKQKQGNCLPIIVTGKTDHAWDYELICCQLKYIRVLKKKENKTTAFLNHSELSFTASFQTLPSVLRSAKWWGQVANQYIAASAHISSSCMGSSAWAPAWAHLHFFQEYPPAQFGSSMECTMEVCSKLEHLVFSLLFHFFFFPRHLPVWRFLSTVYGLIWPSSMTSKVGGPTDTHLRKGKRGQKSGKG